MGGEALRGDGVGAGGADDFVARQWKIWRGVDDCPRAPCGAVKDLDLHAVGKRGNGAGDIAQQVQLVGTHLESRLGRLLRGIEHEHAASGRTVPEAIPGNGVVIGIGHGEK